MINFLKHIIFFRWMTSKFWIRFFLTIIAIVWIQKIYYNNIDNITFAEMLGMVAALIEMNRRKRKAE